VEKCCEVAQEDLTTFFDAWGFFVPMNNLLIGDYGNYKLTSSQSMINTTKTTAETITLYSYIETKDDNLLEYVKQLLAETSAAETLLKEKVTVLFPAESEKLSTIIALVKASYSIPTNINSITIDAIKEFQNIYDLNGRRVEIIIPGNIYIINGKKITVTK